MTVKLVIVESPYAPQAADPHEASVELARNEAYLSACLADCLKRGEVPFASHGFFTRPGVLDDTNPEERMQGILAGIAISDAFARTASVTGGYEYKRALYEDRGWSSGMAFGLEDATKKGQPRERRILCPSEARHWSRAHDRNWGLVHGELFLLSPAARVVVPKCSCEACQEALQHELGDASQARA